LVDSASLETQVVLDENHNSVMDVSFGLGYEIDETSLISVLQKCSFLEVPIKIEGKGVVKIKANFDVVNSNT